MTQPSKQKRLYLVPIKAFTLIELLVVIAVISVLIAVLLPALGRARQTSKRLVCQSQLRQIAQAWNAYLDDHDGRFFQAPNAETIYGGWAGTNSATENEVRPLNSFLKLSPTPRSQEDAKVFQCPTENGGEDAAEPFYITNGTSYHMNVLLVGQGQKGWLPQWELLQALNNRLLNLNTNQVNSPARLALMGDFGWASCWEPGVFRLGDWHGKRCHHNLAFLDGHVKYQQVSKGLYITDEYTVIPFKDLYGLAKEGQEEEECLTLEEMTGGGG